MEGGRLNAADVVVSEMTGLTNIFDIAGTGSLAEISGLMVTNNDFRATDPPPLWSGVNVRDNAMASVSDIAVEDSTNIRYLFGAQNSSMLSVESFDGLNMVGGRQVVCLMFLRKISTCLFPLYSSHNVFFSSHRHQTKSVQCFSQTRAQKRL